MISLFDKVKDTITGFEGIVTAICTYGYGCVRCQVQSQKLKDGKVQDAVWFDEPQLEVLEKGKKKEIKSPAGYRKPPPSREGG